MINYQGVLFDLDGTLMDTAPDFVVTLDQLCDRHGIARLNPETIRNNVSDGSRVLTKLCFPNVIEPKRFEERRLELLKIYEDEVGKAAVIFPEMIDLLKHLESHGIPWGIVTNKPRLYTELLLQRTKAFASCKTLVCADDLHNAKPDPEGILKACEELALAPHDCLYVGDHERDVVAGNRAGCKTVAVTFGYFDNNINIADWNADYIASNAEPFIAKPLPQ